MKARGFVAVLLAGGVLAACQTADRIVLLPDADGRVGQVVVRNDKGERTLAAPYATAEVDAGGGFALRAQDAAAVRARYGELLSVLPRRPVSFMLNFVSGSATELTAESKVVLDQLKVEVAGRPAPEISVIGHTDTVGSRENNDRLSRQRAEAMLAVLKAANVQAIDLEVAGRGERELIVPTADGVDEVRNRRVEINVR